MKAGPQELAPKYLHLITHNAYQWKGKSVQNEKDLKRTQYQDDYHTYPTSYSRLLQYSKNAFSRETEKARTPLQHLKESHMHLFMNYSSYPRQRRATPGPLNSSYGLHLPFAA